ncbi:hypothetical protein MSAS_23830 [Mycobacterium saskatchewanense]|uniref:DUF6745 domain-containing protein n=1 Tax=Mycobacterium saskatchewanense TaxID=220927 RepID=A0AAJ3NP96_9MYCO|nr:hypothetical protein [Mycobacterium saskatchewanense]ORW70376.1 hypothetical protein AWC23_17135 [Mycobacterium saskatchewanense]BBX63209.1 hypothetical protein MSAS_23830 [Mycobacterium saskatchewanense]
MAFNSTRVVELVAEFYRSNDADTGTRYLVVPNLDEALHLSASHRRDPRLADHPLRQTARDIQELDEDRQRLGGIHRLIFRLVAQRHLAIRRHLTLTDLVVISADNVVGLKNAIGEAARSGLGWLIAADRTAIIVPTPVVRLAEGRSDVLHDDTGRVAVVWPDGHGLYLLQGVEFDRRLYFQVINHDLLIQDIAALDNSDQRAIALQYLTFEQLVYDSDAELIDRGVRGTTLYRLTLPPRMARDRMRGHGGYDYFIHMRDASHPEREFVEWVDPQIGCQRDAELCQAHAFGISLDDWLSIEQEG